MKNDKHRKNQQPEFINSIITLRKLQKQKVVPLQITLINLQTPNIVYPHHNSTSKKMLLMSKPGTIYYGKLTEDGYPTHRNTNNSLCLGINEIKGKQTEDFHADALVIYPNGSYYMGEIENGRLQGLGLLTNVAKSFSYKGMFKNGLPHGKGIQDHLNNLSYQGDFVQGKKHGHGKLNYGENDFYLGEFRDNEIEGEGKYYYRNYMWEGNWKNGYLEGSGRQIIAKKSLNDLREASEYKGQFQRGEKHGIGKFKWGKGYLYDGQFKNGQVNGEGTFEFKGKIYAGVWSDGTEIKISELKRCENTSKLYGA